VLHRCTAVGFSDDAIEAWGVEQLHVQAVGVPPYPGDSFPRLVGLLQPTAEVELSEAVLRYVRGDAAQPRAEGPAILAHVVNDRARSWGGRGFALTLMERFPAARRDYAAWTTSGHLQRGAVHLAEARQGLWIASLVAQSGYGDAPEQRPRLRVGALREALRTLAQLAGDRGADVHMPPIGTGQAGGRWPEVRDLILEELAGRHVSTTVYVLPGAPMPEDAVVDDQLTLL
jgi:O-acetyl-ADP-ribose deacetylase (regulator of RNase III)